MPTLDRRGRPALVLLVALALAGLALGACGGSSSRSGAPGRPHTGNDHLISLFGAASQLLADPAGTLDRLKQLGVQAIRVDVRWRDFAPDAESRRPPGGFSGSDPAAYPASAWAAYDAVVRAAAARGIVVDATVGGPGPLWAEGPGDPRQPREPTGIWRPDPRGFGAFVHAVGERYDGRYVPAGATRLPRISFWSVWNEPNYGQDLAPQAVDHSTVEVAPALYRGLLDAAWSALHATGHGNDTLLFGESAPRGITTGDNPGNFSGMVPLRFLRALYCLDGALRPLRGAAAAERGCPAASGPAARSAFRAAHPALFQAIGFAAHLYPQGELAPTAKIPDEPDYADFASLPELEGTLDRALAAYGAGRRLPIFNTEFGYQTNPPELYHASPALASAYLNQAEYLSWRARRVRSYDQYLLSDPPNAGPTSGFDTGLLFKDGTPKPTFQAFRMPLYLPVTRIAGSGSLEVWGEVRPAPDAAASTRHPQRAEIQFAASGRPFRSLRAVSLPAGSGYFDVAVRFPGPGAVRVAWRDPSGTQLFSRSVGLDR